MSVVNDALGLETQYPIPLPTTLHSVISVEELGGRQLLIVGDVHGCLDELQELLATSGVTKDNSLIIFCGDLVNKGPKSVETLTFVRSLGPKAARSVRGNHDEKILYECLKFENSQTPRNRGTHSRLPWINSLSHEDIEFLRELPYTISVPEYNCVVVHAGLVPGVPLDKQRPFDMTNMRNVIRSDSLSGPSDLLFSRRSPEVDGVLMYRGSESALEGVAWAPVWRGPMHVYFGHNASRGLQLCSHATGLDTACVRGDSLTGVILRVSGEVGQIETKLLRVKARAAYSPN